MKKPGPSAEGSGFLFCFLYRLEGREDFLDLLGLVEGAEAAATNFDLHRFAVADEGLLMDIGLESGLGVTVGVADVVAAHTGL